MLLNSCRGIAAPIRSWIARFYQQLDLWCSPAPARADRRTLQRAFSTRPAGSDSREARTEPGERSGPGRAEPGARSATAERRGLATDFWRGGRRGTGLRPQEMAQALFTAILSPSLVMHVAQCTAQSFLFCSGVTGTCGTAFAWSVFSSLMMSSASFGSSTLLKRGIHQRWGWRAQSQRTRGVFTSPVIQDGAQGR